MPHALFILPLYFFFILLNLLPLFTASLIFYHFIHPSLKRFLFHFAWTLKYYLLQHFALCTTISQLILEVVSLHRPSVQSHTHITHKSNSDKSNYAHYLPLSTFQCKITTQLHATYRKQLRYFLNLVHLLTSHLVLLLSALCFYLHFIAFGDMQFIDIRSAF